VTLMLLGGGGLKGLNSVKIVSQWKEEHWKKKKQDLHIGW
jgi:hypothetical protein